MDFIQQTVADLLTLLKVEENQNLIKIVIAILVVTATFLGWFFGLFKRKPAPPPVQQPLTTLPTDQPIMMMTKSAFEAELNQRAAEVEAAFATASKEERTQLEGQRVEIARKLADVEGALKEREAKVRELEALLDREGNAIGGDRMAEARTALEQGDFSKADDLFAEIEAREAMAVQSAARAAYGRGEIAEEQIRWADAAEHYGRAASLEPTYKHLRSDWDFALKMGSYDKALAVGDQMYSVAVSDFGEQSVEAAVATSCRAISLNILGRYEQAELVCREAAALNKALFGDDHSEYAKCLNNLAILLNDQGRYNEAEPLFRQALEIDAKTIGTGHPDHAIRLNNLAELLRKMGRFGEAEPLLRQALEIDAKSIGTAHPDYAIRLNNLALLLQATGRYDEADPLYNAALEILRAKLGSDHPNTKQGEANYAAFLAARPTPTPD